MYLFTYTYIYTLIFKPLFQASKLKIEKDIELSKRLTESFRELFS